MLRRLFPILLFFTCACISRSQPAITQVSSLSKEQWDQVEIANHTNKDEVTFLVLGDMGTGGLNQQAVANAMLAFCEQPDSSCDFVVTLGDNIYRSGIRSPADNKLSTHFENPYAGFGRMDFWMTPGNHDWRQTDSVQSEVDYTLQSERWRMPNNHYAVPNLPPWLHLYSVDTTIFQRDSKDSENEAIVQIVDEMLSAAQEDLCKKPGWRILFAHHPIYSSGKHGLREDRSGITTSINQGLGGLVAECDIQLHMAGHDHHQELIKTDELIQIVQGAGGRYLRQLPESSELVGERWSAVRFGFAAITASADQLIIRYFAVDSFGGGWGKLCEWAISIDGKIENVSADCEL